MHRAWQISDILTCILDAVEGDGLHRKPSLAALAATCKAMHEQPMDRLWVDVSLFDLVSSLPHDVSPVRRARGETSLMRGFVLKISSADYNWTHLAKHTHRIRRLAFRASIALDAEILASIGEFFISEAARKNAPVFPNLRSLTTDYFIWEQGNVFRTWDCIPALAAGGRLSELNLVLPIHITDRYAVLPLDKCLRDVFDANPALYSMSCFYSTMSGFSGTQNPSRNVLDGSLISQVLESAVPLQRLRQIYFHNLPISWASIACLATSTELTTLEATLPSTGSLDLSPTSSFQNLTTLRLTFPEDRPFTDCLKFLDSMKTTKLTELKIACTAAWQDPATARRFFDILSRQQRLTMFSMSIHSVLAPRRIAATVYQPEYDFIHIIDPILSLQHLKVFDLQGTFRLDIDARHLGVIASAWPRLQALIILPHLLMTPDVLSAWQASAFPRQPSLRALETLAKYSPQLKDLRIVMDNSDNLDSEYVESLKEETFDGRLERLTISTPSVLDLPHPDAVSEFLHVLYPGLAYAHFNDRRVSVERIEGDQGVLVGMLPHTDWNKTLVDNLEMRVARDGEGTVQS